MAQFLRNFSYALRVNRQLVTQYRNGMQCYTKSRLGASHKLPAILLNQQTRLLTTQTATETTVDKSTTSDLNGKHEFQADTRKLLEIVAKSLYSDNEVFIRELISNACDALEKFRYKVTTDNQQTFQNTDRPLEIKIDTNRTLNTITIQDSGIGMSKADLFNNLGTIARSGSKQFLEEIKNADGTEPVSNIIGQFGVGFYSAFTVAKEVQVFTKSSEEGSIGYCWTSDGISSYEIKEQGNIDFGTKIVVHLKPEFRQFAEEGTVKEIVKKYSNFVERDILVNGEKFNNFDAIWLKDPKDVTEEQHLQFYQAISNSSGKPVLRLHYKTDVPLSIRALFYIPTHTEKLLAVPNRTSSLALYARKVLISSNTDKLLPPYLRFVVGVVDSEDIPLNLSREILQNSDLLTKIRNVLTNRLLRRLQDFAKKEPLQYQEFYKDFGVFFSEGIILTESYAEREEIAKLLRFDSTQNQTSNLSVSLADYVARMPADQKHIYYIAAPSRTLAENSPYFESIKSKNYEVLFCYDSYGEFVLMQMQNFQDKTIISVEKEMRLDTSTDLSNLGPDSLQISEIDEIKSWMQQILADKVVSVKPTTRLVDHPCVVTVEEMAAARHFIRTKGDKIPDDQCFAMLQATLEINPKHPLIKKLYKLHTTDVELATMLTNQLLANAMVEASLTNDPRGLIRALNALLVKLLETKE